MATTLANGHVELSTSGREQSFLAVYDFAEDGGGSGDVIQLATAKGADFLITDVYIWSETSLASGGAPSIDLGSSENDADGIFDGIVIADLAANSALSPVKWDAPAHFAKLDADSGVGDTDYGSTAALRDGATSVPHRLVEDDTLDLTIGSAALTAGKLHIVIRGFSVEP